jgi:hypothetical protein
MSQGANVRSIESLKRFKVALINFADEGKNSLNGVDMEVRRTHDWLVRDQVFYWKSQVKQRQEALAQARSELHRRQISQMGSDAVSDTEQKEAVREAQRRLREAEDKVERVKRWVPVLEHAIAEYHSQTRPLGDRLSGGLERSLLLLDRMVDALDAYVSIAPPSAPRVDTDGSPASAATTAAPPRAAPATSTAAGEEHDASPQAAATDPAEHDDEEMQTTRSERLTDAETGSDRR